jgi:hypothetical protein
MTGERPWWASDGPVDGGLDTSEDPVERFRSARRGPAENAATGDGPSDDAGDLPFTDEPVTGRPGTGASASGTGSDSAAGIGDPVGGGAGAGRELPPAGPWWEAAAETVSRLARDLAETAEAHGPVVDGGPDDAEGPLDGPEPTDDASDATGGRASSGRAGDDGSHGEAGPPGGRDVPPATEGTPGTADGEDRGADREADRGEEHRVDACGICPICVGLRALGETRPELVGHLAEAARHVALAARSLAARPSPRPPGDEPLQHIGLDE